MAKWRTERLRATAAKGMALLLTFVSLASACAFATAEREVQPDTGLSRTTGLPTDRPYRPILAIINNAPEPGRPLWGLSEADIVYESIIWGPGHTRYAAIYNDNYPEKIGGHRSARYYHEILRLEWDCLLIAYGTSSNFPSDGDEPVGVKAPESLLIEGTRSRPYSNALFRDTSRVTPHNAVSNLALIAENYWPDDLNHPGEPYAPRAPLLQFSNAPTRGEQAAGAIEIHFEGIAKRMPNYLAAYAYNPETRAYDRFYCGYPQMDAESGKRVVANNVIIQFCVTGYYQNDDSRPVINLIGEGPMDAYIDGTRIQGFWKRESQQDQTQFYDARGEALQLMPGKTFIQIIPTAYGYDCDTETGLCRYAPDLPKDM